MVIVQLLAGEPSFPPMHIMTRSYLNFEAVVTNLAWLAEPGASTEDLERQAECVYGRRSLFLFLHTSPTLPSAAELGL